MKNEIRLQKQIRRLQVCVAFLAIAVLVLIGSAFSTAEKHDGVLRARGLIIEDDQGKERILIGSPIPGAKNRVRTDLARVRELWGKRFPEKYMEWYRSYQNDMNGILILDANGFDRVGLGDPVPDPNSGKRIAPSSGLVLNDEEGFERSGYGLLKVESRYRVVLGMDNAQGQEGATLFLEDGGPVGLEIQDGSRHRIFGLNPKAKR
jgi:hypothetical protein